MGTTNKGDLLLSRACLIGPASACEDAPQGWLSTREKQASFPYQKQQGEGGSLKSLHLPHLGAYCGWGRRAMPMSLRGCCCQASYVWAHGPPK